MATNLFNCLHKLDTKTWHWCQLSSQNTEGAPLPKASCGMISIQDSLVVFGGYGRPHGPAEPGSFMKSSRFTDGRGWTNELHIYHLKEGVRVVTVCSRQYHEYLSELASYLGIRWEGKNELSFLPSNSFFPPTERLGTRLLSQHAAVHLMKYMICIYISEDILILRFSPTS